VVPPAGRAVSRGSEGRTCLCPVSQAIAVLVHGVGQLLAAVLLRCPSCPSCPSRFSIESKGVERGEVDHPRESLQVLAGPALGHGTLGQTRFDTMELIFRPRRLGQPSPAPRAGPNPEGCPSPVETGRSGSRASPSRPVAVAGSGGSGAPRRCSGRRRHRHTRSGAHLPRDRRFDRRRREAAPPTSHPPPASAARRRRRPRASGRGPVTPPGGRRPRPRAGPCLAGPRRRRYRGPGP